MSEHVGRLTDAIDNGDGGAVGRLARLAKPSGKTFRKGSTHDLGNADHCPVDGHGRMYMLSGGAQWCPDQSHDAERMRNG